MTKKLQELFELPENNDRGLTIPLPENIEEITTETSDALDKIEETVANLKLASANIVIEAINELRLITSQIQRRFACLQIKKWIISCYDYIS